MKKERCFQTVSVDGSSYFSSSSVGYALRRCYTFCLLASLHFFAQKNHADCFGLKRFGTRASIRTIPLLDPNEIRAVVDVEN